MKNLEKSIKEKNKIFFMKEAIKEAIKAYEKFEVPIGAIIVKDDKIISRGHNLKELKKNTIRHAEINAIEKASKKIKAWRLENCDLYVTLEPCLMCCGAIINSRLRKVYISLKEPKSGAINSKFNIDKYETNHKIEYEFGILEEESREILQKFFKNLRSLKKMNENKDEKE